jgi:hypothetical protein
MIGRIKAGQETHLVASSLRHPKEGASPLFLVRYGMSSPQSWAPIGQQARSALLAARS